MPMSSVFCARAFSCIRPMRATTWEVDATSGFRCSITLREDIASASAPIRSSTPTFAIEAESASRSPNTFAGDELRFLPPSRDFDPHWYAARHMAEDDRVHPFLHFWTIGFDAGSAPSPHFDMNFFKRVVAGHRPDKKEVAFELKVDRAAYPSNPAELEARQRRFIEGLRFRVLVDKPAQRRFLLFVQAGADYVSPFKNKARDFDLLVNVYDVCHDSPADAEIVVFQTGTKATAIRTLLQKAPDLLLRYDAVLFLDDDIEITSSDIDRTFALFQQHGLDLAQPSLTEDSACAFEVLKQPGAGHVMRPLTAVEIMMPVVSRRALATCGDAFEAAVSGWGVDFLLSKKVRERFGETIALLPQIVAAHRRPIDLDGGALYRYLHRHGIDPAIEVGYIGYKFGTPLGTDAICIASRT